MAPPLGLGQAQLADGSWVTAFICEPIALEGARDISGFAVGGRGRRRQGNRVGSELNAG